MPSRTTTLYCADPDALSAMKRDGLGWGHDLECGCFHAFAHLRKTGGIARLLSVLKRRK